MDYQQKRRYSFVANLVFYWALVAYLLLSPFLFSTSGANPMLIACIKSLPILAFASAVIKQNKRQLAWLCFTLLIYFTFTIALWQPQSIIAATLISGCFMSAMVHIRWHNRAINGSPEK